MANKVRRGKVKSSRPSASLCWFDIPGDDLDRAKKFYRSLFGWKFEQFPAAVDQYWHINTGGADASPDGGLLPRMHSGHTITIYVTVPSVDNALAKCRNLEGLSVNLKPRYRAGATSPFAWIRKETPLPCGK
jgi:uncharacterized protein